MPARHADTPRDANTRALRSVQCGVLGGRSQRRACPLVLFDPCHCECKHGMEDERRVHTIA